VSSFCAGNVSDGYGVLLNLLCACVQTVLDMCIFIITHRVLTVVLNEIINQSIIESFLKIAQVTEVTIRFTKVL